MRFLEKKKSQWRVIAEVKDVRNRSTNKKDIESERVEEDHRQTNGEKESWKEWERGRGERGDGEVMIKD